MDKLQKDIKMLKNSGCPWNFTNLNNVVLHTIYDNTEIDYDDMAFHPNGCCGCVTVNDDYIFDIRCDHLMWLVGEHEFIAKGKTVVMLIGNHKGTIILKYLYEE